MDSAVRWTRSAWLRLFVLVALAVLLATSADERGSMFWVGVVLFVINALGLVFMLRTPAPASVPFDASARVVDADDEDERDDEGEDGRIDVRLADLLDDPIVAAAVAEVPTEWAQVSYLEDDLGVASFSELAEEIYVEVDADGWVLAVGDDLKPYLDLDMDEDDDPIVRALRDQPWVASAYHEDREVYRAEVLDGAQTPSVPEFAALAVRALVAHHRAAQQS